MPDFRIVNFQQEWAICEIQFVEEEPDEYYEPGDHLERYEAWVYGKDKTALCRVGQEDRTYPLPGWEPSNFFQDRFPFAIQTKSDHCQFVEKVGGMNNALAAVAAFEVVIHAESPTTTVTLKHGARIIRQQKGVGDFKEWFVNRGI
jgi:hypothetical protein